MDAQGLDKTTITRGDGCLHKTGFLASFRVPDLSAAPPSKRYCQKKKGQGFRGLWQFYFGSLGAVFACGNFSPPGPVFQNPKNMLPLWRHRVCSCGSRLCRKGRLDACPSPPKKTPKPRINVLLVAALGPCNGFVLLLPIWSCITEPMSPSQPLWLFFSQALHPDPAEATRNSKMVWSHVLGSAMQCKCLHRHGFCTGLKLQGLPSTCPVRLPS